MAVTGVTYRYEFGTAIDQDGLNAISAGLRVSRPDLFTRSDTIIVKPAPNGQPPSAAHLLTIYAVINKPIAFSLYPVNGAPNLPPDSLILEADIDFSLTDSILGSITRINVTVQATANIQYTGDTANINLLSFDLIDIEADITGQPIAAARTGTSVVPLAPSLSTRLVGDPLADSFRAIVDYLVELYLKGTLETVVASFPVPTLDKLIGFGGLGTIPISGIFIRNSSFYLMAGNDLGAPVTFPEAPQRPADIRIGISQTGLRRLVAAFLPLPVPIDVPGHPAVLRLTGNLSIPELDFSLPPGSAGIPVKVNIGGNLNLHVEVPIPVFGGTLKFDVPFPIDYLTQYDGTMFPILTVDQYPADPGASVKIGLAPDVSFLGDWVAFVVTDYRDYLADAFRRAVQDAIDQLVGPSFCNVPIFGWIICGTISVVADVIGYLLGAVLDFFASTILTALINVIGRILFLFLQGPSFNVLTIKQADLFNAIGVSISSALIELVENGRDGDLQLSAWIQDQGLPIPIPPPPVTPLPPPQPPPIPPYPGVPTLPEYTPAQFQPAFALPLPTWRDGDRQAYSTVVTAPNHPSVNATFSTQFVVERLSTSWRLSLITQASDGSTRAECHAEYDAQTLVPLTLARVSYGMGQSGAVTTRQSVDLTQPGQATASFGVDGAPSQQDQIPTIQGVALECEDFWPFRMSHATLALSSSANFGTISVTDPHLASNWLREIPVAVQISEGTLQWGPSGQPAMNVPVWIISATEEGKQSVVQVAKDGRGMLQQSVTTTDAQIVMTRIG